MAAQAEYTYTVTETDGDSASLKFNITVSSTAAPPKPSLFGVARGDTKATLKADVPSNGGAAIIRWEYRHKSSGDYGNWTAIASSAGNSITGKEVTGLTNGTAYTFQVRAVNSVGNGAGSDEATVTPSTDAATAPVASETTFTTTGGVESMTFGATVSDDGGANITHWEYEYSDLYNTNLSIARTRIPSSADSTLSATLRMPGGNRGYWRLYACNSVGCTKLKADDPAGQIASTQADSTAPTVTINPANGATLNDASGNITLTFSEQVYQNNDFDAFTTSAAESLVTLKKGTLSGDDIDFSARVTTSGVNANKVITIDPSSDLDDGDVYVEVSSAFYDYSLNQGAKTTATFTVASDTTPPTVSSAAYYSDAALSATLTGTVKGGSDVYTKVTFSETMDHTAGDGAGARPEINYTVGSGSSVQYHIVANTATLASGDCKPSAAPPASVYVCYYKVGGSDSGTLGFEVDTETADEAGNKLAAAWTPGTTLTLEPAPVFSATISDQAFKVNSAITTLTLPAATGGDTGTTLTYSLSPTLPTGLSFSATNRTITGTPGAITAEAEYTYTVTETDNDSASLKFKIEVVEATAPTVTFSPANGALTNAKSADITLTFSEAVYSSASSNTAFTASDLDTLIELKEDDDSGDAIGFAASINAANTVVTVNPSADLADGDVYVEVGGSFYDAVGNQGAQTTATFTVDATAPTVSSAAYYSDAALSTTLTGTVKSGNDIYTKVTFSEKVGHTAGDGASARPEINYTVGSGTEAQYHIVADTATLASGDCKPSAAPPDHRVRVPLQGRRLGQRDARLRGGHGDRGRGGQQAGGGVDARPRR